jgi:hypothetical protein
MRCWSGASARTNGLVRRTGSRSGRPLAARSYQLMAVRTVQTMWDSKIEGPVRPSSIATTPPRPVRHAVAAGHQVRRRSSKLPSEIGGAVNIAPSANPLRADVLSSPAKSILSCRFVVPVLPDWSEACRRSSQLGLPPRLPRTIFEWDAQLWIRRPPERLAGVGRLSRVSPPSAWRRPMLRII